MSDTARTVYRCACALLCALVFGGPALVIANAAGWLR